MASMAGWRHRSHDDLARAGFLFRACVRCKWCGEEIALYRAPLGAVAAGRAEGNTVAVNRKTFQPHKPECKGRERKPAQGGLFDGIERDA